MNYTRQLFGGDWTEEKLERVRKYLSAYVSIMSKQEDAKGSLKYRFAYIDAFAGTGYRNIQQDNKQMGLLFSPEENSENLLLPDQSNFLDGSARIALQIKPQFTKYIFIEKAPSRFAELYALKDSFPNHNITLINALRSIHDPCVSQRFVVSHGHANGLSRNLQIAVRQ